MDAPMSTTTALDRLRKEFGEHWSFYANRFYRDQRIHAVSIAPRWGLPTQVAAWTEEAMRAELQRRAADSRRRVA